VRTSIVATLINAGEEHQSISLSRRSLSELTQAADRAGALVNEQIRSMMDSAEASARELREAAEQSADQTRAEAAATIARILERIDALEGPLTELVHSIRQEVDRLSHEIEGRGGGWDVTSDAVASEPVHVTAVPQDVAWGDTGRQEADEDQDEVAQPEQDQRSAEPEAEKPESAPTEPEAAAEEPESQEPAPAEPEAAAEEPKSQEPWPAAPQPEAAQEAPPSEPSTQTPVTAGEGAERRGLLNRLRRRKIFITEPGACAVCGRTLTAGSERELEASGWRVYGDIGLCPDCQADGWELPEGARVPFRRGH
jgi:hypothetical protein